MTEKVAVRSFDATKVLASHIIMVETAKACKSDRHCSYSLLLMGCVAGLLQHSGKPHILIQKKYGT
ncbi:hypothetical protein PAXRUDRAFT_828987 [Paxillus rubicundulus Ve08.2h10]|uniref:Uncharacterized protein n=1 Tax=Paxillus rubicundulus Ve08.2h10 TaxID=930991 RepID=A0A0D0D914_9AGAM|nr:hypothetical protein PAXRUDRAFT_828987 [Paxillus rubicundulus Ve08.2h10]